MAAIFYLSSQSDPLPAVTEHIWDKLIHVFEYGALGALFARALLGERCGTVAAAMLAVVLTVAYGATDEWHQQWTRGRTSDLHDLVADTVGSVAGTAAYVTARRRIANMSGKG